MRFFTPLLVMALLAINQLSAEGTRQVAPNANINIMGNATSDIAALHINNPSYNNFAAFNSSNALSRLYIHVKDPSTECLYLGFNWAHNNLTSPNPPRINFYYQIKDPNGNIVYGPILVTPTEANIQNWSEGFNGPMQLFGPGGYNATQVTSTTLSSAGWTGKGDYYIEFRDDENNDLLIDFWDITVADCTTPSPTEKKGRVWSYNWSFFAINDFGFPFRPFNGAFYVCAPDPDDINASFVTKIDFNGSGFQPAAFNVAFNSFGSMNTGDVSMDRRSVENANATQAEYAIFLNDPIDICGTATVGEIAIIGVSRCDDEDYCIKFTTTKAGQIDLLLDFDGPDNIYTPGTADVMISRTVNADEVGESACVDWDGLDGLGNPMSESVGTQIPITIAFAQGIYHFPIYDAEYMSNGFMISAVRPAAAVSLVFYDDSNISVPSGSGEPATQLSGCMPPCHRWTNYTQPNTVGFGNLNTINSWWFSQLIIRQDVFFLPSYYTCDVEGPERFCAGSTTELTYSPEIYPAGAEGNEIISTLWTGPGIVGANNGASVTINDGGLYTLEVAWLTILGDTCRTFCEHELTIDPPLTASIDTLIIQGETIEINGETFSEAGEYIQTFTSNEGCDSILTIRIIVLNTIIHYDLNACESFMSNGSHMDYSEFIASYPQPLTCATIEAENLRRENPQVNKHSCTPGVEDSPGMCVVALPGCTYVPGHEASVVIEVNITPDPDTAVHLTGFSFYEKAPATYDWISGSSGPNNYPTLFHVRVLKNGTEIFLSPATPTSLVWQQVVYDFLENDEFLVKDPTTFRFELLAYCPVGNGAVESVWDLDEIDILASCASVDGLNKNIAGIVTTVNAKVLPGVKMHLYGEPTLENALITTTGAEGKYLFSNLLPETDYYVTANKDDDHLNGINTLDLILIQRHLLGMRSFVSPYQKIAADANRNNSITVLDLIELRKLLLGIYTELPNNTSWRFGIAGQVLPLEYPWVMESTYAIESLDDHVTNADFVGIKIGDVNGDVTPDVHGGLLPRGDHKMVLKVADLKIAAGVTTLIDITSDQFTDIAGLQLSLEIMNGRIVDVVSGAIEITDEFFSIGSDGSLLMSWNGMELLTVPSNQVLFSIKVVSALDGSSDELLSIRETGLSAEAYVGDSLDKLYIELESNTSEFPVSGNVLFANKPNPFSQFTTIQFQLEQAGKGTLRFYDLAGRVLHVETDYFVKGLNSVELSTDKLGINSGVVICQLQCDGFVATQKMVVVRE